MLRWLNLLVMGLVLLVFTVGCNRPARPKFKVTNVAPIHTDSSGLILEIKCKGHNPNPVAFKVEKVEGTAKLEGVPVDDVTMTGEGSLPAHGDGDLLFKLTMPWAKMAAAFGAGDSEGKFISYEFQGIATVAAKGRSIQVPFEKTGKLDRMKLVFDALHFLPLPSRDKLKASKSACGTKEAPEREPKLIPALRNVKLVKPSARVIPSSSTKPAASK